MSDQLTWGEVDRDGAIEEVVAKLEGDSRAGFLKKAAVGAGALVAGGGIAGAFAGVARGQATPSETDVLNFALTFEYMTGAFYADAKTRGNFKDQAGVLARVAGNHELSHIRYLQGLLGSSAIPRPRFDFKDTVTNRVKFLQTAKALEDTVVHAYLGQLTNIKTPATLLGAARILSVEGRHSGWVRSIIGQRGLGLPAPGAFDDGFDMTRVRTTLQGMGFVVG